MPNENSDYQEIVPLTDPVVEDISKKPASPPSPHRSFSLVGLIILSLLAVAAASLFYFKTQQLQKQVQDLTATLEAQRVLPTPEPTVQIKPSPSATPSAAPTVVKTEVQQALILAQTKYPDAQLILITSDNPHLPDQTVAKYWFRQTPDSKKYLYVSFIASESNLVDQQIYVSPDNNIPSLNQRLKEDKLGLNLPQVLSLADSLCKQPEKCQQAAAIKAQFLDTGKNLLWQVTYQISDQASPLIFQIDSLTQTVVYQSPK